MMAQSLGHGLRTASKRPALVSLLWAINAALGLLATIPAWTWWRNGFAFAPASDRLLDGFNFGTYFDLEHYNRMGVQGLLNANVAAVAVTAAVIGALAFGGTLEILRAADARSFLHRFFRGAGHFFGRFLRLTLYTAIAAVLVVGLVAAALAPALQPLDDSTWEPGWVVAAMIRFLVIGGVLLYFYLVLDYARIRVAVEDTRRAFRTWFVSLGFVLRHLVGTYGIALAFGALVALLLALYLGYCAVAPIRSRGQILLLVAIQQAVIWLRAGLRVARTGAEVDLYERLRPAPAAVILPATAPGAEPEAPIVVLEPDAASRTDEAHQADQPESQADARDSI